MYGSRGSPIIHYMVYKLYTYIQYVIFAIEKVN